MAWKFNPFTGQLDEVGSSGGGGVTQTTADVTIASGFGSGTTINFVQTGQVVQMFIPELDFTSDGGGNALAFIYPDGMIPKNAISGQADFCLVFCSAGEVTGSAYIDNTGVTFSRTDGSSIPSGSATIFAKTYTYIVQ